MFDSRLRAISPGRRLRWPLARSLRSTSSFDSHSVREWSSAPIVPHFPPFLIAPSPYMVAAGRDPEFERLLASTQALASQIKQQHMPPPPQRVLTQVGQNWGSWHEQQHAAGGQQQGYAPMPPYHQQIEQHQHYMQKHVPLHTLQSPHSQGLLSMVETMPQEQRTGAPSHDPRMSSTTSSSNEGSTDTNSRNISLDSAWGKLDAGQLCSMSLDSEMAYASVEELLADGFLDDGNWGKGRNQ